MRKVIVQEFITIDGFAAGLNNELDFMPGASDKSTDTSVEDNQWDFIDSVDTMLLGRKTYEMFVEYWPTANERIAEKLNTLNKIVFSQTLKEAPWGKFAPVTIVNSNPREEIAKLKGQSGKNLVIWGSLSLVQSLVKTSLIDDYELIICPSVLGKGKKLFTEDDQLNNMKLIKTKTFDAGSILLHYQLV